MPQRVANQTIIGVRDGKRFEVKPGETHDFTDDEIQELSEDATREPKDETIVRSRAFDPTIGAAGEEGAEEANKVTGGKDKPQDVRPRQEGKDKGKPSGPDVSAPGAQPRAGKSDDGL